MNGRVNNDFSLLWFEEKRKIEQGSISLKLEVERIAICKTFEKLFRTEEFGVGIWRNSIEQSP